ncbi:MAG: bifunctional diaminohydroxyphosphoribosylaminopyrimidine deaminase/5-amino-6-(5-phosphoribosylamino)uracil reductase RibD, partial [Flavobacteriaceae bacterium]
VYQDQIIGEGWHQRAGGPHAEVNAIQAVKNPSILSKSTLYVSLEPCSHYGKTPPCASLIIRHKIPKVVIASKDPNPIVSGRGISMLLDVGCEVVTGVLESEANELNRRFFTYQNKKRPYILLKWAQTADRFIAPEENESRGKVFWISSPLSRKKVHQWRSQEQSILIGVQTAVHDNPQLTTRAWAGKNPIRMVLDPKNRIAENSHLMQDNEPCLLINKQKNRFKNPLKKSIVLNPFSIERFLQKCFELEIQSILVEGGQKTIQNFIDQNLWDEARVFNSLKKIQTGVKAPTFNKVIHHSERIETDRLDYYFNQTDPKVL